MEKVISEEMTKEELIDIALRESRAFSKEIQKYLYEMAEQRPLTEQELKFYYESTLRIILLSDMCQSKIREEK